MEKRRLSNQRGRLKCLEYGSVLACAAVNVDPDSAQGRNPPYANVNVGSGFRNGSARRAYSCCEAGVYKLGSERTCSVCAKLATAKRQGACLGRIRSNTRPSLYTKNAGSSMFRQSVWDWKRAALTGLSCMKKGCSFVWGSNDIMTSVGERCFARAF